MRAALAPGVFTAMFEKMAVQVHARTAAGLTLTAAAVARQAQTNASVGTHAYRTPTPASPGHGPSIISKTLVNSVAFSTPRRISVGWSARVGPRDGMFPAYNGKRQKTPSSKYGGFLEKRLRNGTSYPWLLPAKNIVPVAAVVAFRQTFAAPWL